MWVGRGKVVVGKWRQLYSNINLKSDKKKNKVTEGSLKINPKTFPLYLQNNFSLIAFFPRWDTRKLNELNNMVCFDLGYFHIYCN